MTTQKEMEEIRAALSWFDVRRYDGLKDLTLEQIYAELERRMLAYKTRQQWETAGKDNQMQAIYHDATIRCGDVILKSDWISDNHRLSHSYAVRPMTRVQLFNYGRAMYRLETSEQTDPVAVSSDYISEYLKQGGMNPANKMLIEIDLEEASSDDRKRTARTVLTGMCYSVGSVMRQGSSSLTRLTGQSAMTSRTWRR